MENINKTKRLSQMLSLLVLLLKFLLLHKQFHQRKVSYLPRFFCPLYFGFPLSSIGIGALKSTLSDAVTHLTEIIVALFSRSIFSALQAKAAAEPVPWQSKREATKPP